MRGGRVMVLGDDEQLKGQSRSPLHLLFAVASTAWLYTHTANWVSINTDMLLAWG